MNKKILISFMLILMLTTLTNAAITNLKVTENPKLGEKITIAGTSGFTDSLCQFLIIDGNGFVVERLSDEFSFADGTFYAERTLTEPPFFRDVNYTAKVICNTEDANSTFIVGQMRDLQHGTQQNFLFIFDKGNTDVYFIFGSIAGIIILFIIALAFAWRMGLGKP